MFAVVFRFSSTGIWSLTFSSIGERRKHVRPSKSCLFSPDGSDWKQNESFSSHPRLICRISMLFRLRLTRPIEVVRHRWLTLDPLNPKPIITSTMNDNRVQQAHRCRTSRFSPHLNVVEWMRFIPRRRTTPADLLWPPRPTRCNTEVLRRRHWIMPRCVRRRS